MIKVYCHGMDTITYNKETRKWEKWGTTCVGGVRNDPTKKKNWINIDKWWSCTVETFDEAKEFIAKYRDAYASRDYKAWRKLMSEYENK